MMEQQQEDDKGEKITTKDDSIQSNNPNIISSNLATDRKKKIQKKKGIKKLKSSTTETMKTYHTLGFGSNYFHLFGQDAIPITDEYYHDKDDHDEGDFEKEEQQQNLKQRPSSAYMFQSLPPGCTGVPYSNSANSNVTNRTIIYGNTSIHSHMWINAHNNTSFTIFFLYFFQYICTGYHSW